MLLSWQLTFLVLSFFSEPVFLFEVISLKDLVGDRLLISYFLDLEGTFSMAEQFQSGRS